MNCLLCQNPSIEFSNLAYKCSHCGLVFKNPNSHLSREEDVKRYSTHQNNSEDQGYKDFLNRLLVPLSPFLPEKLKALDYGCGPGPTISILLGRKERNIFNFDPIFFPNHNLLLDKYDLVTTTEVVEHFKDPLHNWTELVGLVKEGGLLGVMTQFFNDDIDYQSWWYKNDPTHVVFYQEKTLNFLCEYFNLTIVFNDKKSVIIFRKN